MRISLLPVLTAILVLGRSLPAQTGGVSFTSLLEAGVSRTVAVDDDILYGGLGGYFLTMDVSNPALPHRVASKSLGASVNDIALSGNLALVAASSGLIILDVSNPLNPITLGVAPAGNLTGVDCAGQVAYVTRGSQGMRTVDFSNPSNPIILATFPVDGWPIAVRVSGTHAYVAGFINPSFAVVDVSNPVAPTQVGSLADAGSGESFDVIGSLAYLPSGSGLAIVNVSVPASPVLVSRYASNLNDAISLAVSGNYAYVLDRYYNFDVVDVSDPAAPVGVTHLDVDGGNDMALQGSRLYIADEESSFRVVELSEPTNPEFTGICKRLFVPKSISVVDGVTYVGESRRVSIWDSHNPDAPGYLSEMSLDCERFQSVFPRGDLLFAGRTDCWSPSDQSGIWIMDVNDPAQPHHVGWTSSFDNVFEVLVDGNYAYLLGYRGDSEFAIYDVANPAAPVELSSVSTEFIAWNFDLRGNLLLLANEGHGLKIYDVSNPLNPVFRSVFAGTAEVEDVVAIGETAFIADPQVGLIAVDFSNPNSPVEVGRMTGIGQPMHIAARNPYVVLAGTDPILRIIDVSDPALPVLVADYQTGGSEEIAIHSPYISTLVGSEGSLLTLKADILNDVSAVHSPKRSSISLRAHPNPFNPTTTISFNAPTPGPVDIAIYDASGAHVVSLLRGDHRTSGSVTWDGRNSSGQPLASGVYYCRLVANRHQTSLKLVLVK